MARYRVTKVQGPSEFAQKTVAASRRCCDSRLVGHTLTREMHSIVGHWPMPATGSPADPAVPPDST